MTGVCKVCEWINKDLRKLNSGINGCSCERKRIKDKVDMLCSRIAFLEEANIKKEGRINFLEGVLNSMLDKLC